MQFRKFIALTAVAASMLAPSISLAATPQSNGACVLKQYRLGSVKPYRAEERMGRVTTQQLRGAEIFVQAAPGLTSEWLQLTLLRDAQQMHGTSVTDCVLDVQGIQVDVDSAGTGFRVKLIAKDSQHAEEVLRRARLLVNG